MIASCFCGSNIVEVSGRLPFSQERDLIDSAINGCTAGCKPINRAERFVAVPREVWQAPSRPVGRPKLTEEEKAERKTTRPSSYVPTGGRRGRPRLTDEQRAEREAEYKRKHPGAGTGKRGRPRKNPLPVT